MDTTHLHLLLNHFPIIGSLLSIVTLIYGIISGSRRTTKIALIVFIAMSIAAIPVYLTGEPAEKTVKNLTSVSKGIIEEHEEAAEVAFWIMMVSAVVALITLVNLIVKNALNKSIAWITILAGTISFMAMARTGYLGGQIRHSEIRTESTVSPIGNENPGSATQNQSEDSD